MLFPAGLFSTIKIKINDLEYPATHTTPNSIELNRIMAQMVDDDCEYCFMEVSSHAIEQKRIAGLTFAGGIFSNITQDHLDYHKTMEQYIKAKQKFFDNLPETAFALTNIDDKNGNIMVQNTKAQRHTYALKNPANFKARVISKQMEGMLLDFDNTEFWTCLIGEFNAANLLSVYAVSMILNYDKEEILTALSNLPPVKGRFERYCSQSGIYVIVDYAHTPDAVANVLTTINDIRTANEKVITIIGAGGDRDKSKRPLMAKEAARYSDILILTSDNPRSENPNEIIEDMKKGLSGNMTCRFFTVPDRKEAIKVAAEMAQKGDIILIAGKGHETYQEINGKRFPFDDMNIAIECMSNM
jgi:UDP-N-acetylmuramoyl-L-alanyl-D-glutamate--2,6-diaminopimelate ligase